MQRLPSFLLACASLLLCSCNKFSNGDTVTQKREINGHFHTLILNDDVDVTLRHSTYDTVAGSCWITAGDHLIDQIRIENPMHDTVIDNQTQHIPSYDTVLISNDNTLNWLRPYDTRLHILLYYDKNSLGKIIFNTNGEFYSDALQGVYQTDIIDSVTIQRPHLSVDIIGGSSDIHLTTETQLLHLNYYYGTASLDLQGEVSSYMELNLKQNSHGPVNGRKLWVDHVNIHHSGTGRIITTAKIINASINNNGEVVYYRDLLSQEPFQTIRMESSPYAYPPTQ